MNKEIIEAICDTLIKNKDELNRLDSICGDGECGSNLVNGANNILESLNDIDSFRKLGMILNSAGCGTLGTMLSFLLMRLDKATTLKEAADIMKQTFERKSDATVGDKTMADALIPWVHVVTTDGTLPMAAKAAMEGAQTTTDMLGKFGRGKIAGGKAIGTMDPGAYATALIFEQISEHFERK